MKMKHTVEVLGCIEYAVFRSELLAKAYVSQCIDEGVAARYLGLMPIYDGELCFAPRMPVKHSRIKKAAPRRTV